MMAGEHPPREAAVCSGGQQRWKQGAGALNGDCSKSLAKLSRLGGPAAKQVYNVFQWVEV